MIFIVDEVLKWWVEGKWIELIDVAMKRRDKAAFAYAGFMGVEIGV